jgi:hypothetical protein
VILKFAIAECKEDLSGVQVRHCRLKLQSLGDYVCLYHQGYMWINYQIVRRKVSTFLPYWSRHRQWEKRDWNEWSSISDNIFCYVLSHITVRPRFNVPWYQLSVLSVSNNHLSATRIDNCMFYLQAPFHSHTVPDCICSLRPLESNWRLKTALHLSARVGGGGVATLHVGRVRNH